MAKEPLVRKAELNDSYNITNDMQKSSVEAEFKENNNAQKETLTKASDSISTVLAGESISTTSAEVTVQKTTAKQFTVTKAQLKEKNDMSNDDAEHDNLTEEVKFNFIASIQLSPNHNGEEDDASFQLLLESTVNQKENNVAIDVDREKKWWRRRKMNFWYFPLWEE